MGSVMCHQIWDQFWQSQLATIILVQCRQMVGSSVLEGTNMGSVMCQKIWDQFWQSQPASDILDALFSYFGRNNIVQCDVDNR